MFECRFCHKDTDDKKNNAFYCDACTKLMKSKKLCALWRAGDSWIWVRQNKVVRVMHKDKFQQSVYVRKELMEGDVS